MTNATPIALGVASHDWDGYIDQDGTIHQPGTRGWCVSTATGDAVFNPPHNGERFRFVTKEPEHFGPVGVC